MKTVITRLNTMIVVFALVLLPFVASAQGIGAGEEPSGMKSGDVSMQGQMEILTVTGIVSQNQRQLMLESATGNYLLTGDVDEALIGKNVIATGVMLDNAGEKTFDAQSIKVVK